MFRENNSYTVNPPSASIHGKVLDEPIPALRPPAPPLLRKQPSQDGTLALAAGNTEKIQILGSMEYGPVPPPPQRGRHLPSFVPSSTVVHAAFDGLIHHPVYQFLMQGLQII
ncbi:hypothetical protein ARMSODRAFT_1027358 [Armillaria solidipes]|uniref:Uncharacterized protein n=1 Tax=Armillaria solidipes TaxID=1076256 RepID=A0A2H3B0I0_9AGAR|nr:hypothetical protein ARMSODRAFT_1027358 [Armillaria solidipes]